ncbi:MAG: peptide deformylase [Bacteroidota bacterium]
MSRLLVAFCFFCLPFLSWAQAEEVIDGYDLQTSSFLTTPETEWSLEEIKLIQSGEKNDPLRLFLITNPADSVLLRTQSQDVIPDEDDAVLNSFIDRLYATVTDSASMGVGIAAPQVGLLRNIIWVQRFDKEGFPFEVYLNPVIRQYSKKRQCGPEGCLSIPEVRDSVFRSYAILLEYDDRKGEHHYELVEDFTAVIFQHEIDHLNGIVFTDHVQEELAQAKAREKNKAKIIQDKEGADSPLDPNEEKD